MSGSRIITDRKYSEFRERFVCLSSVKRSFSNCKHTQTRELVDYGEDLRLLLLVLGFCDCVDWGDGVIYIMMMGCAAASPRSSRRWKNRWIQGACVRRHGEGFFSCSRQLARVHRMCVKNFLDREGRWWYNNSRYISISRPSKSRMERDDRETNCTRRICPKAFPRA